jgi:phospholipid transport system substrate-binding protein
MIRIKPVTAAIVVLTILCGFSAIPLKASVPPQADPMGVVQYGVKQVIAVFNNQQMPLNQRRDKLRSMSSEYLDFVSMAKSALGPHWRELGQSQRDEFVPLFADFIQDAYLSKLEQGTVEKVRQEATAAKIDFVRQAYFGHNYAEVYTTVKLQDQNDPLQVNFMMHRTDNGWRVYDLSIDAISIVGNYRTQFNRVINRSGYAVLVQDLKAKRQQLRTYMNQEMRSAASPNMESR